MSEPFALVAFVTAFVVVLLGGSVLMFAVKGGTVDVLTAANADAGPIEQQPLTIDLLRHASRFTLTRFTDGCARLFRPVSDGRPGLDDRVRLVGRQLSHVRRLRLSRGRRPGADHRLDVRGGTLGGRAGGMADCRQHAVPAAADRDGGVEGIGVERSRLPRDGAVHPVGVSRAHRRLPGRRRAGHRGDAGLFRRWRGRAWA